MSKKKARQPDTTRVLNEGALIDFSYHLNQASDEVELLGRECSVSALRVRDVLDRLKAIRYEVRGWVVKGAKT